MRDEEGRKMPSQQNLKVSGHLDIEVDGHVMTVVGYGGMVALTTIDTSGATLYVYHPQTGWMVHTDMTEDDDELSVHGH